MSDAPKPKKKGGLKVILLVVIPLILISGGVVGAAVMGVIHIPGLTPAKKGKMAANANGMYGEQAKPEPVKEVKKPSKPDEVTKTPVEPPKPDLDLGAKKLAKIWNEIDVKQLQEIISKWKDEDVARVLAKMETSKVAELLSALASDMKKPAQIDRAGKLSELLQLQAAVVAQK